MKTHLYLFTFFTVIVSACAATPTPPPSLSTSTSSATTPAVAVTNTATPKPTLATDDPPPSNAQREFKTDFSKHTIPYSEIFSGGPPKDGIPALS
ncbi:MAG: hypothetical protein HZC38_16055, partial [Chloroflexi bacterium]|nr:hypothetical protein [Chloroflexota bacterium]